MRNYFLITILLLPFTAWTQTILLERSEIFIGTSHGTTMSQLMFVPNVRQDILIGYNGGISFRYVNERNLGLQIELNYSQRGWLERYDLYARRLDYIELPFLAHISTGGELVSFFFTVGPKLSMLLQEQTLFDNTTDENRRPQHTTAASNRFEYGVTAGLGLEFAVSRQRLALEARANYSLISALPSGNLAPFSFANNMNLAINLSWMVRVN